jgi:hypothetical protein
VSKRQDAEWSHWSDREIAKHAKVHHEMVGRLRPRPVEAVTGGNASEARTFTTKHGKWREDEYCRDRQEAGGRALSCGAR